MPPKKTILIVDDEKDIVKLLEYNLQKEGYVTLVAPDGERGVELARAKKPDLVILDLMLPGLDGLEVCKILKSDKTTKNIPVVMLTAKGSEIDQVVGLEIGANDYVPKPFSVKVLLARLKNIFRLLEKKADPADAPVLKAGDLMLDAERMVCTVKGKSVSLTKLEFNIVSFLMQHPGKVFSRDKLLSGSWGGEAFVIDRTVDVHIRSIRAKLGVCRDYIETVRGTGYRFVELDV